MQELIPMTTSVVKQATACLLVLGLLVSPAWVATADDNDDSDSALLTARGSGEIPGGGTVRIMPHEDRPEYADLIRLIGNALGDRNLTTAARGDYVLRFGYRIAAGDEARREDPNFGIVGRTGTTGASNMQMRLRLRNEQKASPGDLLLVTFEFYQPGLPPLWIATIQAADDKFDRMAAVARMIELAMGYFGKNGEYEIPLKY